MPKKGYIPTKAHRENLSKINKEIHNRPEVVRKHREAQIRNWQNPSYRKKNLAARLQFFKDMKEFVAFRKVQRAQEKAGKK